MCRIGALSPFSINGLLSLGTWLRAAIENHARGLRYVGKPAAIALQ
jgi:hypothetical protein